MSSSVEYTDKSVSGLPCAYANLVAYAPNYAPGTLFDAMQPGTSVDTLGNPMPAGAKLAVDGSGNPLVTVDGSQLLIDANGNLIPLPYSPHVVCGYYNPLALAYGTQ